MSAQAQTDRKPWRPDKGDPNPLVGKLLDVTTATGDHGPYPLAEILDANGCTWSFHAFREVAESELRQLAPQVGDEITIHWAPPPEGKTYHLYRIRFADGRGRKVDWNRVGTARPSEEEDAFAPDGSFEADGDFKPAGDDEPPF